MVLLLLLLLVEMHGLIARLLPWLWPVLYSRLFQWGYLTLAATQLLISLSTSQFLFILLLRDLILQWLRIFRCLRRLIMVKLRNHCFFSWIQRSSVSGLTSCTTNCATSSCYYFAGITAPTKKTTFLADTLPGDYALRLLSKFPLGRIHSCYALSLLYSDSVCHFIPIQAPTDFLLIT